MSKRSYNKKNLEYWNSLVQKKMAANTVSIQTIEADSIDYSDISLADNSDSYYNRIGGRSSSFSSGLINSKYPNLANGILPYQSKGGIITMTDAIKLCQLAYANVAIVRNTIDTMTEFSNNKIHIKTENQSVKRFFEKWLDKINIWKIGDEFYREYYRSGNVFFYRFDGKFDSDNFNALKSIFALKSNNIPIAYTILNPAEIGIEYSPLGYGSFVKMLSVHELGKLRESDDPSIKEFLSSLDNDAKNKLLNYKGSELYMTINPNRLSAVFYKKQSYEPLALPMVYPVLDDIEWKMSLKNMDKVLSKCIDNIILLITMGEKKDQHGGGINYKNITRIQEMFKNRAAGRVIVSDYTTKAEFIVPNFEKILGPEKYQIVDRDIRDGLQNILAGGPDGEKFSNLAIKTKVFLERLKEGQNAFLAWLRSEIIRICEDMNFKNIPDVEIEQIDMEDKNLAQKTFIRLYELGMFTPEDLINAFKTGLLPDISGLLKKQEEYKKQREDKYWYPLLGGSNFNENNEGGRPDGSTGIPKESNKVNPRTSLSNFEDIKVSIDDIKQFYNKANEFIQKVEKYIKRKLKIKSLNEEQLSLVAEFATNIITRYNAGEWINKLDYCFANMNNIENTDQLNIIRLWKEQSNLDEFNAAIIYHANMNKNIKMV